MKLENEEGGRPEPSEQRKHKSTSAVGDEVKKVPKKSNSETNDESGMYLNEDQLS